MLKTGWTNGLPEGHNGGPAYRLFLGTGTHQPLQPSHLILPRFFPNMFKVDKNYVPSLLPFLDFRFNTMGRNWQMFHQNKGCVQSSHLVSKFPFEKVCLDLLQSGFAETCGQTMVKILWASLHNFKMFAASRIVGCVLSKVGWWWKSKLLPIHSKPDPGIYPENFSV